MLGWGRMFLLSRSECRLLANPHGWSFKTICHFHCRKPRIFECEGMPFGLCNAPVSFYRLMQNWLGELNVMYCLIYLDNVILFSKMEEEHLKHLCIVFDHFQEHNPRIKPTKCEFFLHEINYLAHHVYKEAMWPSKENLKAVAEFVPPKTYTEIRALLGLVGHYRWFIKGFACVVQHLHEHLSGEGACKKGQQVTLMVEAKVPLILWKGLVLKLPCWHLLTLTSHFF